MPKKLTPILPALKELLSAGEVSTQEEICQALIAKGIHANQSKISRSLRKIGAIKKLNDQGEAYYSLSRELQPPSTNSPLGQLVIDISANEVMIVIRTTPGSASLIAHVLDHRYQELQTLGTVAGDDTLFVVPRSTRLIPEVLQEIKKLLQVV